MKFPTGYPDFGSDDKAALKKIGVTSAQSKHLRLSLSIVRMFADPNSYASSAGVSDILTDIEKLSTNLSRKLGSLARRIDAEHGAAYGAIEVAYWSKPEHANNSGQDVPSRILPELHALSSAAKIGRVNFPARKGRPPTADPRPIRSIDQALRHGWIETHGSGVRSMQGNESMADILASARSNPPTLTYPEVFNPNKADGSGFRTIVGICYRAVGANIDPVRAIENYLAQKRRLRRESIAAIEKGIAAAERKGKHRPATKQA